MIRNHLKWGSGGGDEEPGGGGFWLNGLSRVLAKADFMRKCTDGPGRRSSSMTEVYIIILVFLLSGAMGTILG